MGVSGGIVCNLFSDWFGEGGVMLSWSGVAVMGGIFTLGNFGAPLVVRQVDVLLPLLVPPVMVGPWRVEKFQLVGLTPAFDHRLCVHMVLLVIGCGGHGSVLSPL